LRPNIAELIDSRGFVYLKMKNPDAAIADYNAALAISPKMASSLYGRGLAERIKGDQAAASKDIAAAKAIQPDIEDQFAKWGVPAPKL
jgi:tetratricopeptide (TPR) repeat protein